MSTHVSQASWRPPAQPPPQLLRRRLVQTYIHRGPWRYVGKGGGAADTHDTSRSRARVQLAGREKPQLLSCEVDRLCHAERPEAEEGIRGYMMSPVDIMITSSSRSQSQERRRRAALHIRLDTKLIDLLQFYPTCAPLCRYTHRPYFLI
jgi:hypothetical protein